jgi:hypothetical protein
MSSLFSLDSLIVDARLDAGLDAKLDAGSMRGSMQARCLEAGAQTGSRKAESNHRRGSRIFVCACYLVFIVAIPIAYSIPEIQLHFFSAFTHSQTPTGRDLKEEEYGERVRGALA